MSVSIQIHPTEDPPSTKFFPDEWALDATVTLIPDVTVLFGVDHAKNVAYLREWAASLVALADEIEAAQ